MIDRTDTPPMGASQARPQYVRLPGRSRKQFSIASRERGVLWLGPDHVLHIRSMEFSETCRRFYFQDIQALTVCRTDSGRTIGIALGAMAIASLAGALLLFFVYSALVPLGLVLAAGFGILALVNAALGPTCLCRLYTAVQVETLTSLGRLRSAEKTIAILKPLIEAAQGRLETEAIEAGTEQDSETLTVVRPATASAVPTTALPLKHEHGRVHAAFFALLALLAATVLADLAYQGPMKNILDSIVLVAALVLGMAALGRQPDRDTSTALKNITWIGVGVLFAEFAMGAAFPFVYSVQYSMEHPGTFEQPDFLHMHFEGVAFTTYCVVSGTLLLALSMFGAGALLRFRAAYAARSAAGSSPETPGGMAAPQVIPAPEAAADDICEPDRSPHEERTG